MEIKNKDRIKLIITGTAAGTINGLFGGGGGVLLVPLLSSFTDMEERRVFATAVSITLPLSIFSGTVYHLQHGIDFSLALPFMISGLIGGIIGSLLFKRVPVRYLRKVFGLLIIYSGLRSLLWA